MTQKTVAVLGKYNPLNYSLYEFEFARLVGAHIGQRGGVIATDTGSGFSAWASLGSSEVQGMTIGFSPASSRYEHENHYRLSLEHVSSVVYTGFGYLGRDLLMVRSSDAVLVFLGNEKIGHEGLLAKELQKPLIVITLGKEDEIVKGLLGDLYDYAEKYSSQKEVLKRIETMFS